MDISSGRNLGMKSAANVSFPEMTSLMERMPDYAGYRTAAEAAAAGAAEGAGLWHEFLRHVERARVLVILLDPTPLQEMSYAGQLEVLTEPGFLDHVAARDDVEVVTMRDLAERREQAAREREAPGGLDRQLHRPTLGRDHGVTSPARAARSGFGSGIP